MMRVSHTTYLFACAMLCMGMSAIAYAQPAPSFPPSAPIAVAAGMEDVQMLAGDILEILPSHSVAAPVYSWILTKDNAFIQAGRSEVFRYRFIQPGTYTLAAEITSAQTGMRLKRTFRFDVRARIPGQTAPPAEQATETGSTAAPLVRTVPAQDSGGRLVLREAQQLVILQPIDDSLRPLAADINLSQDSDGDGNPTNDIDTKDTFFQSDATPLMIWIADPLTMQSMSVTAVAPNGIARSQNIDVLSVEDARRRGLLQSPVTIEASEQENGTFAFRAPFTDGMAPAIPLLYQWEFGDGQQSLIQEPTHTYAENAPYTVRVRIRDLQTGTEVASDEQSILVQNVAAPAMPSSEQASSVPTDTASNQNGIFANIGTYLLYGGILLVLLLLLVGVAFAWRKLQNRSPKKRSLSDTIEKVEKTLLKTDTDKQPERTQDSVTSGADKKNEDTKTSMPPREIAQREEERAQQDSLPAQEPRLNEKNAPSWLKSGLQSAQNADAQKQQKPAAPAESTPRPNAANEQKGTPMQAAPAQRTTPPWLKQDTQNPSTPSPVAQAPAAPPSPQQQAKPAAPATQTPAAPTPKPPQPAMQKQPVQTPATAAPAAPTTPATQSPVAPAAPTPKPQPQQPAPAAPAQPEIAEKKKIENSQTNQSTNVSDTKNSSQTQNPATAPSQSKATTQGLPTTPASPAAPTSTPPAPKPQQPAVQKQPVQTPAPAAPAAPSAPAAEQQTKSAVPASPAAPAMQAPLAPAPKQPKPQQITPTSTNSAINTDTQAAKNAQQTQMAKKPAMPAAPAPMPAAPTPQADTSAPLAFIRADSLNEGLNLPKNTPPAAQSTVQPTPAPAPSRPPVPDQHPEAPAADEQNG